jgi:dihydrodipicolinate synthase/N-acetylneuraminate lyase
MALKYSKGEAKDWAREHMKGVCNVIMPSFTSDLKGLNEAGIRHDVRKCIEFGFWGSLVVSECATTKDEYKRFLEIVIDEAKGRLYTVVHGSFDTLEDVNEINRFAESAGADVLLTTYPPNFYPTSQEDIRDYTERVMAGTNLASVIFSVHQWGFGRLHPSDIRVDIVKYLAALPNAVAVKAEGGPPGNGAIVEILDAVGDQILVSDPRESWAPGHVKWFGMQWMGTSNFEAFNNVVPTYFRQMHEGKWKEAMENYWKIYGIRTRRLADLASFSGANFIHRTSWKYQSWLNGFNGGPMRLPTMRISAGSAAPLREAMIKAGTIPADTPADLTGFYAGRIPA